MPNFNVEIIGNINQDQIEKLINFYLNSFEQNYEIIHKVTGEVFDCININLIPLFIEDEIQLELDPIYLGYLVLILEKFTLLKVKITVENDFIDDLIQNFNDESYIKSSKISDRAFSIHDQILFLKYNPKLKDRIEFIGKYYNKEKKSINIILKKLESSKRFFPIILINSKEDVTKYFNNVSQEKEILYSLYLDKTLELLKPINDFKLPELSIIQVYILRLLLTDDNEENKKITKSKIEFYVDYSRQLSYTLKELALNIVEHSRAFSDADSGIGVITGRIFEKNRIVELKSDDEMDFLNRFEESEYFLDINVFDLGFQSLRDKYVENIEKNIGNDYSEIIDCETDREVVKNKSSFTFQDFYIPNSKTQHQSNRIISRYGIQYFTQICTKRFEGFIKAISHNEGVVIERIEQSIKEVSKTRYGTSYNCILPISKFNKFFNNNRKKTGILLGQSTDVYSELLKYNNPEKLININSPTEYDIIIFEDYPKDILQTKYDYNYKIRKIFIDKFSSVKENIIILNAEEMLIDTASGWIRLLAELTLDFPNLIVYNIEKEITREIVDIRRVVSNNIKEYSFWNNDSCVLFYSYQKHKKEEILFRYGATALTGNSEEEYNYVNKNIWKCHYSYYKDFIVSDEESSINLNNKFFLNANLLAFDLLISINDSHGSSISLFEKSIQYALNKSLVENLDSDINNKGYKVIDTHFRLGSKIHIDNFYYAKRVFQNSFFATPLAFLIAKSIHSEIDFINRQIDIEKNHFTILGYDSYSEFLVSVIRNILNKIYRNKQKYYFNHNTINSEAKLSRPIESIQENIFIVVPIASTFSTSIKIKNDTQDILQNNRKDFCVNFLEPHFNVILVGKDNFESDIEKDKKVSETSLLKEFGWVSVDNENKIVEVQEYSDSTSNLIKEKYYIPVYSNWYKAENCQLCFPENYSKERCLIETGISSITPRLVFGFPKTKQDNSNNRKLNLIGSLLYGNLRKGDNKYLYFTRVGEIINKKINNKFVNLELIKLWLQTFVKEKFKTLIENNNKIVLVTPSTSTKSNFIDLVNEIVFNYSANCLTISIGEDYIENSDSLYSDGLFKADIVVFVDDVLSTIQSFIETSKIINYIRNKNEKGKGIDYCISLINRMTFESEEDLLLKITDIKLSEITDLNKSKGNLLYYCKINNPTISEPNKKFPLSTESNRYHFLSKISSLDSTRSLFYTKYIKLKKHDIVNRKIDFDTKKLIDDEIAYGNKKLFQLLILDKVYTLFEYHENQYSNSNLSNYFTIKDEKNPLENFKNLVAEIEGEFYDEKKNVKEKHKVHSKVLERYVNNLDFVILKIICSTPLIYYKQIRESAFSWVLKYIELCINGSYENKLIGINNLNKENLIKYFEVSWDNNYSEFQKLKFLLKRAVQLKSNVIIHEEFFLAIQNLITLLHNNYDYIKALKNDNEIKLIILIDELFKSEYNKEHLELYDYVDYLNRSKVISEDTLKTAQNIQERQFYVDISKNYNPPQTDTFQFEDDSKVQFESLFNMLKLHPKYRITNSKGLMYNLIVLIKELIYEHEPKAIELERRILKLKSTNRDPQNGTFNLYLRLLQLENTSAIDNFYEKEKERLNNKIIDNREVNYIKEYQNNPIFKSIKLLLNQGSDSNPIFNSFNSFLKLKSNIDNWLNDKNQGFTIDLQIKLIQTLIEELVGSHFVNEVNLSVNLKDNTISNSNDIFFFDAISKTEKHKNLYDFINEKDINNSLKFKMYEGVKEFDSDYPMSNLEIIKKGNNYDFRNNTNLSSDYVSNSLEFQRISQDCNLLFLRISDFSTNSSNPNSHSNLKAIAVFTIYLNTAQKVDEKILRLLLLLRNPICQFLTKQVKNGSMSAYISSKSTLNYQKHLKHGIGNYLNFQSTLARSLEKIDSKLENKLKKITEIPKDRRKLLDEIQIEIASNTLKTHNLLNRAIVSQIKINDRISTTKNTLFQEYFIDMIQTVYNSKYLSYRNITELDYKKEIVFIERCEFPIIQVYKELIDSILFELIFNQKKYGINRKIIWEISGSFFIISFVNDKCKKEKSNAFGYGTLMCKEISEKTKGELEIIIEEDDIEYKTILKIKI